jgi:hypothetical protein
VILLIAGVIGFVGLRALPQKPARSEAQLTPEYRAPKAKQPDPRWGFFLVFDPSAKLVRYKTLVECQAALAAKGGAGLCVSRPPRC